MLHTASRITSRLATRQTRAFNTAHLRRSSLSNESVCEIITDSKDPRLAEVYRLRHSVGSAVSITQQILSFYEGLRPG